VYRRTNRPRRPAIPVTLHALVVVLLATRAMMREGQAWLGGTSGRFLLTASVTSLAIALACRCAGRGLYAISCVVAVSLGCSFVLASCALQNGSRLSESLGHASIADWELRITSDPVKKTDVYRCRASVTRADGLSGDVWLSLDEYRPMGTTRCAAWVATRKTTMTNGESHLGCKACGEA
jgi:hypothetical protein